MKEIPFIFQPSFQQWLHPLHREPVLSKTPPPASSRSSLSGVCVIVDKHGLSEYMVEFKKHFLSHYRSGLFEQADFVFASSKDQPLLQIADMIAGSVRRVYEGDDPVDLIEPLKKNNHPH